MRRASVLRLGHRVPRDERASTHLALAARALGAEELIYSGDRDPELEAKIRDVVGRWGGGFRITYTDRPLEILRRYSGQGYATVHLTMYGVGINDVMDSILRREKVLVIVGGEKVPRVYFEEADYNVAVGWQPHSEIAALAIFLDRYFQGREVDTVDPYPPTIVPMKRGKLVIRPGSGGSDA